ncbi:UPF0739 protein C1orf74-like protein isoform X2 [Cucumis melo var. makuwa]|uniref:UPF0739 protein C1orf74-like protein isoform X2 n=1 Tax=Cucumis melo var. makuwa TaxID=1194695 RepID=A0A5D3DPY3_CUCMM|nr:UPF0739 protein C1orf74-like protein isoform X2 [Cucumis melo var. makuwa]TYK25592.1 UPF0739 protein C1orf74-like protein isoform X2 [Cucumis melo var. makuwa]
MEAREMEEALKVLDSSLSQIKWRLKFPAKRRLQLDVLALCTGMRPVVMIDYGGKMPELQQRLCALLKLIQTELHIFENLKVMVIEDMIYLIHVQGLAEHVHSTLNSKLTLLLVDIEQDPPKMLVDAEKSSLGLQLKSIQKLFSSLFSQDETEGDPLPSVGETCVTDIRSSIHGISSQSSVIDLSNFLQHTEITLPTLNGWLLGYPIVYLFDKDHISEATYNLSAKPLHIFRLSVNRRGGSTKESQLEELLSFSVPYELSMRGEKEAWAEAFLESMQQKWERCSQVWGSLRMDVTECHAQAIVFIDFTSIKFLAKWRFEQLGNVEWRYTSKLEHVRLLICSWQNGF